ncbi:MAG: accessory gene regulator B family protein [Lachnospiraceae bacterium]|jgi:accessory gene regulator B|nr:accessory gene regulator B family protein [Lachnospiraceae bacterium]
MLIQITKRIIRVLLHEKIITQEDVEVYEYGCQITLANIINFIIVLTIGIIFKSVIQSAIFYLSFISLRIFCGGYHANSYHKCFFIFGCTCSICILLGHFLEKVSILTFLSVGSIFLLGMAIYKKAPIEHENRPFMEEERKKFRKKSFEVYVGWVIICSIFRIFGQFSYQAVLTMSFLAVLVLMMESK